MKQNTKDWIQYSSAIALIASAIVMAFTSFIVISDITAGVNAYIGIAISCALAIFGVSAYMVNQIASFKTEIRREMMNIREEEEGGRQFGGHRAPGTKEKEETSCTSNFEE